MKTDGRNRWLSISLAVTLITLFPPSALSGQSPPTKGRVVNVTADSAPGWIPSRDDERAASEAAKAYLAASDAGDAAAAYAMLADGQKAVVPFDAFSQGLANFRTKTGPVVERRIVMVTWTKDSPRAPGPGVYAAIDLVSRFALAQRSCGYVVLMRPDEGGAFKVAREETNLFTDADAAKMEREQSKAAVDAAWAQLTVNCPNYPGETSPVAQPPPPSPEPTSPPPLAEDPHADVGYATVAAALADLTARKGATVSDQGGWTIISDPADSTIWSFVPKGHPAWPAVVKRHVFETKAGVAMDMKVLCQSTKVACDNLVRAFQELNAQMSAGLKAGPPR